MRHATAVAVFATILPLLALPVHAAGPGNFTVHTLELPQDATSLAMGGDRVAVLTRDGLALLYRISGDNVGLESRLNLSALHPQLLALQGSSLLVCGDSGVLYLLDPASGRVLSRLVPRPAQTPLEERQRSCIYLASGVAVYNDSVFFVTLSPGFSMVRGFVSNRELAGSWGSEIEAATTYIGMVYAYTRVVSPDTIIAYAARTPQGHLVVGVYSLLVTNSAKTQLDGADTVCSIEAPSRKPSHIAVLAAKDNTTMLILYRPPGLLYEPGRGEAEIEQDGTLPPGVAAAAAAWLDNSTLLIAAANGTIYTYDTESTRMEKVAALGDNLPPCTARISVDTASGAAALAAGKRLYIVLPSSQPPTATPTATAKATSTRSTDTAEIRTTTSHTATPETTTATTRTEATSTGTAAHTPETTGQTRTGRTPHTAESGNEKTATYTAKEKKTTETTTTTTGAAPQATRQTPGQLTATTQSPTTPGRGEAPSRGIALAAAALGAAAATAILRRR